MCLSHHEQRQRLCKVLCKVGIPVEVPCSPAAQTTKRELDNRVLGTVLVPSGRAFSSSARGVGVGAWRSGPHSYVLFALSVREDVPTPEALSFREYLFSAAW